MTFLTAPAWMRRSWTRYGWTSPACERRGLLFRGQYGPKADTPASYRRGWSEPRWRKR